MQSLLVFSFSLLAIFAWSKWATKLFSVSGPVRTYKRAVDIQQLLNPSHVPLKDLLRSRAAPNQRLVHAFGLTNTFVSGDTKVHKTFTARAKALIARTGDKGHRWRAVGRSTEAAARRFLLVQDKPVTDFATLVQCVTFSVVLSALFDTNLDALAHDDVVQATEIINQRWKDSKVKDAASMRRDDGPLRSLVAHIDRWITDRDRYGANPLDLILPAYETMWRVVAATVAHVYRCCDNTRQDTMIAFGRDPTEERFQTFGDDGLQPSMQAIVLEVLRLHPPTRRIVRARNVEQGSSSRWWRARVAPAVEIADVGGVHLSDAYGENTSEFDPMRFHPSRMRSSEPRPELYAFGFGRLKCVAAGWAPMAAAVIAATTVWQIEERGCVVTVGPKIGGRSGWDGWTVRRPTDVGQ